MNNVFKIRSLTILMGLLLLLLLYSGITVALTGLDIPWWRIDGGGGQISNGSFVLNASIGQADAGAMSGGNFDLNGGFWDTASAVQGVAISSGWNMISSYIDPNPAAMSAIFPAAYDATLVCKNDAGGVYWPAMAVDSIGNWDPAKGYQCNTETGFSVAFSGTLIPVGAPLALPQGWNLIGYWRNIELAVPTALSDCSADLVLVKNGAGEVYWPDYSVDQIGNMQPGEGYQMYLNNACNLSYPLN